METLGPYTLTRMLGCGGSGVVYEAVRRLDDERQLRVALKVLHQDPGALHREARIAGLLRHRHLVDVFEVGEVDGTAFCAMELCAGCLADHAPLPPRAVVEAGLAVCDALQYAHADLGLVHLDLKPPNLLYTQEGVVKVADLGSARAEGFDGDQTLSGTPGFMPPEQLRGGPVGPAADVYALARTLLALSEADALATVTTPDWGATLPVHDAAAAAVVPAVMGAAWLDPIVEPCLSPRPSDRPTMAAVAEVLRVLDLPGPGLREHLGLHAEPVDRRADEVVGRGAELAELAALLATPGVITLRGPAGIGKTRLAREALRRWTQGDGRGWFCDLTEATDLDGLVSAVARALDVPLRGEGDAAAQLGHALAARARALVVLDNFEQVVQLAPVVGTWRARAPEVRFLVTSRVGLGLPHEHVVDVDVLGPDAATALLAARARDRGVDVGGDPRLTELARRLDGVPLALELAAGRLGVLSVADVLERLGLSLLRSATDDRHGTLRAAFDWSWGLLGPEERAGLARLSVFASGFTAGAAAEVATLERGGVEALVAWSWLRRVGGRYAMLESVRAYAAERLSDGEEARRRHGVWAASLGRRLRGVGAVERFQRLKIELDNLVVACRSAAERGDVAVALDTLEAAHEVLEATGPTAPQVELAERVARLTLSPRDRSRVDVVYGRALARAGRAEEGAARLSAAVDAATPPALGRALGELGSVLEELGRPEEARAALQRALAIHREGGDPGSAGVVLEDLGGVHQSLGRMDEAIACYEEAVHVAREVGDALLEGVALASLGGVLEQLGRMDEARAHVARAVAIHGELDNRRGLAPALLSLGNLDKEQGRLHGARARYDAALAVYREVGDRRGEGTAFANLGIVARRLGDRARARTLLVEALAIHREVHDPQHELIALCNLGILHNELGRLDEALAHFTSALDMARDHGNTRMEGVVYTNLGVLHHGAGRDDLARTCFEEALVRDREVGNLGNEALVLGNLGVLYRHQGDPDRARASTEAALAIHRQMGARASEAMTMCNLAVLHLEAERVTEARALAEEARAMAHEVGSPWQEAVAIVQLARVEARVDPEAAMALLDHEVVRAVEIPAVQVEVLSARAEVASLQGDLVAARHALAALERLATVLPSARRSVERARALVAEAGVSDG